MNHYRAPLAGMIDWSRQRPFTTKVLAGLAVVFSIVILWRTVEESTMLAVSDDTTNPFHDLYIDRRNNDNTSGTIPCQETFYQPFLVGCPADCRPYRTSDTNVTTTNEPMYRLSFVWYLGQPRLQLHPPSPEPDSYYDMGKNYQSCSSAFVDAFGRASDQLESALLQQQQQQQEHSSNNYSDLVVTTQARMHLTLAYLCCLTLEEAYHVREIMQRFIHDNNKVFHIPNVRFERVECWKERFNSITHIIVVDNASQQRLLILLQRLERAIQQEGIAVSIPRQSQMPFHVTLLGVRRGEKYSTDPPNDIEPIRPVSYQALQDVWPPNGVSFDIQHLPKYSWQPVLQAVI
jgi:2'-5' RNA ligase